ncbi:MAG: glycosyltransferase family 4 protein [Tepidisphaeraceae bacterium]|jgi:hypothetical protein
MDKGRVFYVSHDIPLPRGGIGILYDHVAVLRRHGLDAFIVQGTPDFVYPFAHQSVPVIYSGSIGAVSYRDTFVIPEDHPLLSSLRSVECGKILFCQNHYYIYHGLDPGQSWTDFGIQDYMALSQPIGDALRTWFGVEATVVRPAVDELFFTDQPAPFARPLNVAFMPRKGTANLRLLQGLLGPYVQPKLAWPIRWRPIDALQRPQVAEILESCPIYITTPYHEGLGLPSLEAMAAGCLVIGYRAGGGLDYATDDNGLWVPDDDPFALAQKLQDMVGRLSDPSYLGTIQQIRQSGQATARRYSSQAQEAALLEFWRCYFHKRQLT